MWLALLGLWQGEPDVGRWVRENDFDMAVRAASDAFRVDAPLIKAIIAAESQFDPRATRGEPQIGDASIGLMQVLYSTARRNGYPGAAGDQNTLTGLYNPGTNLYHGAKYLAQLLVQTGGDVDAVISAYNGGFRPELGFGAKRTAATPVVCLRWKPTGGRVLQRDCAEVGSQTPGEFSNQRYVDKVKNYLAYFFAPAAQGAASP